MGGPRRRWIDKVEREVLGLDLVFGTWMEGAIGLDEGRDGSRGIGL